MLKNMTLWTSGVQPRRLPSRKEQRWTEVPKFLWADSVFFDSHRQSAKWPLMEPQIVNSLQWSKAIHTLVIQLDMPCHPSSTQINKTYQLTSYCCKHPTMKKKLCQLQVSQLLGRSRVSKCKWNDPQIHSSWRDWDTPSRDETWWKYSKMTTKCYVFLIKIKCCLIPG